MGYRASWAGGQSRLPGRERPECHALGYCTMAGGQIVSRETIDVAANVAVTMDNLRGLAESHTAPRSLRRERISANGGAASPSRGLRATELLATWLSCGRPIKLFHVEQFWLSAYFSETPESKTRFFEFGRASGKRHFQVGSSLRRAASSAPIQRTAWPDSFRRGTAHLSRAL